MSRRCWFVVLLLLLLPMMPWMQPVNAYDLKCHQNQSDWMQPIPLPEGLALKNAYKVVVRHTNWLTNVTSLVMENRSGSQAQITTISRTSNTTHFVMGNRNYTYNETACAALSHVEAIPSLYVASELAKMYGFNGNSMAELINFLLKYNFTQHQFENATETVGGIDALHWLGCRYDDNKIFQVEVAYAGSGSLAAYSSTVKNPYILSVHIAAFNLADKAILGHDSADVTELEELPADTKFNEELPEGLFCSGFPEAKIPVSFPEKFEISFDYTDVNGKVVHDIDMFYNGDERIFSMQLNAEADRDAPFVGNATLPKGLTNIHVIHDFQYGFQYLMDAENSVCSAVTAIDENFGDTEMVNASTKEIDLKKPAQLFWSTADSTFYYAGKRTLADIPLDVYVTKVKPAPTTTTTVEMLYTTENWVVETATAPFLHSIIQYHEDQSGKKTKTVIRVHAFKNGSVAETQRTSLYVYPCLRLVDDSYLYVNVKNTSLKELENLGIGRVREGLREAVAHVANVSVLRIANFFFKQLQANVVAFFVVGEATGIKPANTRNRSNETNTEMAVQLLNTTLKKMDITFTVVSGERKTELKLSKASLGTIPSTWGPLPTPEPSFRGYTGGSMFVLGFFMLLLGAALGVGVVYFIWKRQRISGLAYQVFE